jgi:hypothetical protein
LTPVIIKNEIIGMKKIVLSLFVVLFLTALPEARTGGPFGLGLVVGAPTGITGKLWTSRTQAWTGALAFSLGNHHDYYNDYYYDNAVYINVMHTWHDFNLADVGSGELPFYLGVGGRLWAAHHFGLGVRGCGGVSFMPARTPIDIFLEIGVVIDIVEEPGGDVDAGLGVRYYF